MVIEVGVNKHHGGRNSNNEGFSAATVDIGSHVSGSHNSSLEFYLRRDHAESRTQLVVYRYEYQSGGSTNTLSGNDGSQSPVLGELEYRILRYLLDTREQLRRFQLYEITKGLNIDKRRAWDAVQRLLRRGIVRKLARGLYELDRAKALNLVHLYEERQSRKRSRKGVKDSDSRKAARGMANTIPNASLYAAARGRSRRGFDIDSVMGVSRCNVARVHARVPSDGDEFHYLISLFIARDLIEESIRFTIERLRIRGVSEYRIREARREARRRVMLFLSSGSLEVRFGMHGLRNLRVNTEDITYNLGSKEIGVDFVSDVGLPKIHVKVYTDVAESVAGRPLTSYVAAKPVAVVSVAMSV